MKVTTLHQNKMTKAGIGTKFIKIQSDKIIHKFKLNIEIVNGHSWTRVYIMIPDGTWVIVLTTIDINFEFQASYVSDPVCKAADAERFYNEVLPIIEKIYFD